MAEVIKLAGAHADYRHDDFMFRRTHRRDDGSTFIPSKPIRSSILRGLVAAILAWVRG